ncbi:MAG: protein kinase, partial [Pseudomonadota bacterium]
MNQEEARKILGMREGDTDILSNFARRKKLFTNRLDAAPNERLREQYQDMINQLEQAAAVLALVEQQYSGQVTPEQPGILQDNTNANTVTADHTPLGIIELSPGQILSDRYEIKQQIGKDDIGVLLRVFDQVRKREVAIKVIYPELLSDETVKQNFLTEINRASELYHPGIMNIAGIGNDGDYHFLIMELLRGRTLRRMMNSRKKNRKPFSLNEIIHIVSSLAKALNYARIKTAHGDLRPGNIWVDEKGTCKIMGYGTNRLLRISKSVQTGGE